MVIPSHEGGREEGAEEGVRLLAPPQEGGRVEGAEDEVPPAAPSPSFPPSLPGVLLPLPPSSFPPSFPPFLPPSSQVYFPTKAALTCACEFLSL